MPEIDISEICDQFYNRRERNGMPVESLMQVFSSSMNKKTSEMLKDAEEAKLKKSQEPIKKGANTDSIFNLTKNLSPK